MFDFERYYKEQVEETKLLATISNHDKEWGVYDLRIYDIVLDNRTYMRSLNKISVCNLTSFKERVIKKSAVDIKLNLDIYADFGKQGDIIRIYNFFSEIIPCWGHSINNIINLVDTWYLYDNMIISIDASIRSYKNSVNMIARLLNKNSNSKYELDLVKGKSRFVLVKVPISVSRANCHSYCFFSGEYGRLMYEAFEIYLLFFLIEFTTLTLLRIKLNV